MSDKNGRPANNDADILFLWWFWRSNSVNEGRSQVVCSVSECDADSMVLTGIVTSDGIVIFAVWLLSSPCDVLVSMQLSVLWSTVIPSKI